MTEGKQTAVEKTKAALAKAPEIRPGMSLQQLLRTETIQSRFKAMLKEKAPGFLSSMLSVQASNKALQEADPMSIVQAAAIAASLDLPINPSLGLAWIVPYKGTATFQLGAKGFRQLAIRSGQYRTIGAEPVHAGEIKRYNRLTGEIEFADGAFEGEPKGPVVGYIAYFKMLNGFEKHLYMSAEQVAAHAKRFSQAYKAGYGPWKDDFEAMALKTVSKLLLSRWGLLSIDIQKALTYDQAAVSVDNELSYPDGTDAIEAKAEAAPVESKKVTIKPTQAEEATVGGDVFLVVNTEKNGTFYVRALGVRRIVTAALSHNKNLAVTVEMDDDMAIITDAVPQE